MSRSGSAARRLAHARIVYSAQPSDALLNWRATGDGADRVGVIDRAIDYSTFEHLVVRADGSVEKTNMPPKVKMILGSDRRRPDLSPSLPSRPRWAAGRCRRKASLPMIRAEPVPAGRRLSLVYAPVDGEYVTDIFAGFAPDAGRA